MQLHCLTTQPASMPTQMPISQANKMSAPQKQVSLRSGAGRPWGNLQAIRQQIAWRAAL